ncbi:MAG: cytochrome c [Anaerolineae bacterium]|nr:cytochrome c [Anaerolineae bacterium]
MNHQWRVPCLGIPLLTTLCVCSALILLVAANTPTEPEPNAMLDHIRQEMADDDGRIRIFDQYFDETHIAQGEAVYQQYCAACHGVNAEGQFPAAPLQPDSTGRYGAPPHNETGHTWHHSDVLLLRYLREGGFADPKRFYQMPSFGAVLTEEQMLHVIAYIKTLWTPEQRVRQRYVTEEEARRFGGQ